MPLHLLGKKSWNVYNADNIAKVKADEAEAAAREAAEEQRMQEVDAERRIQILRGLRPEDVPCTPQAIENSGAHDKSRHDRKRRRIAGEDDTDRDLRVAREHQETAPKSTQALANPVKSSDAPLTDRKGHINLFPAEGSRRHAAKNPEAEAEAAKKKREYEDQYTMRFSNAAGFKHSVDQKPWYSSVSTVNDGGDAEDIVLKDVWGNGDPRRKEREKLRLASDDPMAAIQKGVSELRQVERERQRWREERDRELRDMDKAARGKAQRKRRRVEEVPEFEDFSLDATYEGRVGAQRDQHRHQHRHHHRHGSTARSKDRRSTDAGHYRHPSRRREANEQPSLHEADRGKDHRTSKSGIALSWKEQAI